VDWFTMNVGARLDLDSMFGVHLSPRAALIFVPHESASLRISYAEAFRGPSALELYGSDPTYVVRPRSLEAEIVRTAELEWQQRIGFASFSLRGYAAFYKHFIAPRVASDAEVQRGFDTGQLASTVDPAWVVTNDNVQRINAYGGSAVLQARPIRGLTVAGSVTVSRTHSPDLDDSLWPYSFGNLRLSYEFQPGGPALSLAGTFAHRRRAFNSAANAESVAKTPIASDALDLRLTLTSPIRAVRGLSMRSSAGVRVLPDAPYLITGSPDVPELRRQYAHDLPQLHLLLGASYDF
jgi:outer membrane receptor protein involved in Fe transport